MTAHEVLHKMTEAFDADAAGDTEAVIQYQLSEPVYHVVRDGTLRVHDGQADDPDLTVKISDDNLVKLFRGDLNPMTAFMTGKIRVSGDMTLAQRLVAFVDRERLASLA
jgi:putative sterol carrier protein